VNSGKKLCGGLAAAMSTVMTLALLLGGTGACEGGKCLDIREKLYQAKKGWVACEEDSQCVVSAANLDDCTGLLGCPFAFNVAFQEEVDRQILRSPVEHVACERFCLKSECARAGTPVPRCSPRTKTCFLETPPGPAGTVGTPGTAGAAGTPGTASVDAALDGAPTDASSDAPRD